MSWDRKKCRNVIYFMTAANTSKDHTVLFFFCHNIALSHVQLFIHIISPSFSQVLLCRMQFLFMFLLFQFFVSFQSAFQLPVFMVFSDYHLLMILSLFLVKFLIFFKKWEGLCFLCMQCGVWSSFVAEVHVHLMNLLC